MALLADRISKQYDDEPVLQDVSLEVVEGESLAVTGPSGSGKSTLLSILGLLLLPTQGDVVFQGQRTAALSDDARSRLRNCSFGFIFQSPQLIGSLSVLDNVLVPARLARRRNQEAKARQTLADIGLQHRLTYFPHQLSIGQKRRVAIARALLLDPVVIFADEPTNDLDPERAAWVGDFLFSLPQQGRALVMATHDTRLAARADRVIRISERGVAEAVGAELSAGPI